MSNTNTAPVLTLVAGNSRVVTDASTMAGAIALVTGHRVREHAVVATPDAEELVERFRAEEARLTAEAKAAAEQAERERERVLVAEANARREAREKAAAEAKARRAAEAADRKACREASARGAAFCKEHGGAPERTEFSVRGAGVFKTPDGQFWSFDGEWHPVATVNGRPAGAFDRSVAQQAPRQEPGKVSAEAAPSRRRSSGKPRMTKAEFEKTGGKSSRQSNQKAGAKPAKGDTNKGGKGKK